jgi:hypothetical protein
MTEPKRIFSGLWSTLVPTVSLRFRVAFCQSPSDLCCLSTIYEICKISGILGWNNNHLQFQLNANSQLLVVQTRKRAHLHRMHFQCDLFPLLLTNIHDRSIVYCCNFNSTFVGSEFLIRMCYSADASKLNRSTNPKGS